MDLSRPTRPPLHRNRHSQETCVGREWLQLPILQMGWDKKKFSWRKASLGTAEISSETTNDRELPERGCFADFIKIPLPNFEGAIADQQVAFRLDQLRLHVFEIDALNRLLNVQIPLRAGCRIGSVPIERPVSRVAILLDFDQQIAGAYGMNAAGRKENGIACLNGNSVNVIDHGALAKSLLKAVPRDRLTKSKEELGVRMRGGHVPKLALWLASQPAGNIVRRMHLQRQLFLRIENFDEQRKTWSLGNIPKDFVSLLGPQFVQSSSAQRAAGHDALRFGTIDNFPRFTDTLLRRKLFVKFGFEAPPAPHSLDENRLEGEGSSDFVP
jgi:hypothetical protein